MTTQDDPIRPSRAPGHAAPSPAMPVAPSETGAAADAPQGGLRIGIAGAGLLGRLAAWHLAAHGHRVQVFDPAPNPGPCFADGGEPHIGLAAPWVQARAAHVAHADAAPRWPQAAGFTAAGILSPIAELDNAEPALAALGWRSIVLWRAITQALGQVPGGIAPFYAQRGSWMLAHRPDLGSAQRVLARPTLPPPRTGRMASHMANRAARRQVDGHGRCLTPHRALHAHHAHRAPRSPKRARGAAGARRSPSPC